MRKLLIAAAALSLLGAGATPALAKHGKHKHHWDDRAYAAGYDDGRAGVRPVYYAKKSARKGWYGRDGRYYGNDYARCRRDSNIEGTVAGAAIGGVLGNVIAPRGSKTIGTVVGAGVGGVIGNRIDHGEGRRCY